MRSVVGVLISLSIVAGVVISLHALGPCNHSLWQFACVVFLYPAIFVASFVCDLNSWEFQRCAFLLGLGQGAVLLGLYMAAAPLLRAHRRDVSGSNAP